MNFRTEIGLTGIVLAGAFLLPSESSAAVMTFDDRSAFESAVTGLTLVEDGFDTHIPEGGQIVFDSGVISTRSGPAPSGFNNGVIWPDSSGSSLQYFAAVSKTGFEFPEFVAWSFPNLITGFGFDLSDIDVGGLQIGFDGGNGPENFLISDVLDMLSEGFVGFVADTAFQTIIFSTADPEIGEGYLIDNLVFTGTTAVVPLPATLPLTLFGIGGLLFFTRGGGTGAKDARHAGRGGLAQNRRDPGSGKIT